MPSTCKLFSVSVSYQRVDKDPQLLLIKTKEFIDNILQIEKHCFLDALKARGGGGGGGGGVVLFSTICY